MKWNQIIYKLKVDSNPSSSERGAHYLFRSVCELLEYTSIRLLYAGDWRDLQHAPNEVRQLIRARKATEKRAQRASSKLQNLQRRGMWKPGSSLADY